MSHASSPPPRAPGHVAAATAAIGTLSLVLAIGLQLIGMLTRFDKLIATLVSRGGAEGFPRHLPTAVPWLAAALLAYGLAFAILASHGTGRRVILWITAMVLVAAWAPVLSLASFFPGIGAAWIATAWSGVCAIVHAGHPRAPVGNSRPSR